MMPSADIVRRVQVLEDNFPYVGFEFLDLFLMGIFAGCCHWIAGFFVNVGIGSVLLLLLGILAVWHFWRTDIFANIGFGLLVLFLLGSLAFWRLLASGIFSHFGLLFWFLGVPSPWYIWHSGYKGKELMIGNLPVVHELRTVVQSVADQITGHPEKAHERWDKYFNESVLVHLLKNKTDRALQLVTSHDDTAKKLKTNFLRIDPVNEQLPAHETKDIVVVMDGSASLGSDEFNKGKTALKKLIGLEEQGGKDTKYAAVTFSNSAVVNFPFLPYTEAANKISTIRYLDGGTNTGAGLREAKKLLLDDPSSGSRTNATKIVLLVTDGLSTVTAQRFAKAADKLKESGVKIFVLAVGTFHVNGIDELVKGASSPPEKFLFRVASLEFFLHVVQSVVEEVNSSLYIVPPHNDTAKKLITDFLRIDPVNKQYPRHDAKDIVVVMEGSASIGSNEFNKGKAALKNMIGLEREGGSDTKYAAVTLSDSAVVNFAFLPYADAADKIITIPYPSGSTNAHAGLAGLMSGIANWTTGYPAAGSNIQAGLKESKKLFDDSSSGGHVTKMVFLVIDGQTNLEKHMAEVDELKNSGVQIFAVAVGSSTDGIDKIANAISSPPEKFLFRVESLEGFLHVVELAVEQVYSSFYYAVPHYSDTATKLKTNFLRDDPTNDAKDIVVIMDGSASTGEDDFNKGKNALKNIIGSLGEGKNDTKYAAVTFSSSARASSATVNFIFTPRQLAEDQILKLPSPAGRENTHATELTEGSRTFVERSPADGSNILAALMEVKKLFDDPKSGCRTDATKMAFLLIDGKSNFEECLIKADVLKNMGVKIFVVAVGSSIDGSSKIVHVASSPPEQFFFRVESLDGFFNVVELVSDHKKLCETVHNVIPPPNVTATKLIINFLSITIDPRAPTQSTKEKTTKDIVILLDSSGSIRSDEFDKGKTALKNMIGLEEEGGNDTKYAAVTFSDGAFVNFSFLPCAEAENMISTISYQGGQTNTQAGLTEAKKLFDDLSKGHRANAAKNVFLVTDGQSNVDKHLTIPKADELKKSGVQIFVVGVGSYIDGVDELVNVASSPPEQFLFRVESLEGFLQIVHLAVKQTCPARYVVS